MDTKSLSRGIDMHVAANSNLRLEYTRVLESTDKDELQKAELHVFEIDLAGIRKGRCMYQRYVGEREGFQTGRTLYNDSICTMLGYTKVLKQSMEFECLEDYSVCIRHIIDRDFFDSSVPEGTRMEIARHVLYMLGRRKDRMWHEMQWGKSIYVDRADQMRSVYARYLDAEAWDRNDAEVKPLSVSKIQVGGKPLKFNDKWGNPAFLYQPAPEVYVCVVENEVRERTKMEQRYPESANDPHAVGVKGYLVAYQGVAGSAKTGLAVYPFVDSKDRSLILRYIRKLPGYEEENFAPIFSRVSELVRASWE